MPFTPYELRFAAITMVADAIKKLNERSKAKELRLRVGVAELIADAIKARAEAHVRGIPKGLGENRDDIDSLVCARICMEAFRAARHEPELKLEKLFEINDGDGFELAAPKHPTSDLLKAYVDMAAWVVRAD